MYCPSLTLQLHSEIRHYLLSSTWVQVAVVQSIDCAKTLYSTYVHWLFIFQ